MRKAWLWATVVVSMIPLAPACGDGDSTKTRTSGAAGAPDGEAGDTGVGEAGGPAGSGEAGAPPSSGGEAGGAAGEPGVGGAPSDGGTGGSSGGSGGTGGTNGGTLVACLHPYGTSCTEFTGSSERADAFAVRCSNLEMFPESDCSREGVSGVCSWTDGENGEESYQRFHYQLDADALEDAQSECDVDSGTWATP